MHNIKDIRKNPDLFIENMKNRFIDIDLKKILDLDENNRKLIQEKETLEKEKKDISKKNDKSLFENVVQPVRDNFGVTVINSGYRGPKLNEAVGGSSKSQHCKGEAVDIECPGTSNYAVASWIEQNLDFDQLILEFYTPGIPDSGWVHVSYKSEGNRKSILTAMKENGKTVYKPGLIE